MVKESLLQTATETLLLHSSLTTNNSWPLLFSKRTINTETHVSGGHVNINFLLVHYPSSGGREGPLFIREIFEYPPRYTPTLNGNQRVHWLTGALTLEKHDSLSRIQTWIGSMNLSGTTHLKLESRPASRNFPDSANLEDKKGRFGSQLLHLSFAFMSDFLETDRNLSIIFSLGMFNEARRRRMRNHVARISLVSLYTFV